MNVTDAATECIAKLLSVKVVFCSAAYCTTDCSAAGNADANLPAVAGFSLRVSEMITPPPLQSDAEDAVQRHLHGGDAARLLPLRLDLGQARQDELTPHRSPHALAVRILRVKYCSHFVYCFVDDSK